MLHSLYGYRSTDHLSTAIDQRSRFRALVDRAISQGRLREIWAILEQYWLSYVNFWECHLYLLSQLYDV